jgi:SAM-dependent methyltransferase
MNNSDVIVEVMRKHGATCSPEEFQSIVNLTFHKYESRVYDELHRDMWESLPKQFNLIASDCMRSVRELPGSMNVLDVGCGTGLASDCLTKSSLGPQIASIDLLDTSGPMLDLAARRAKSWGVKFRCIEGLLDQVELRKKYDLIVVCSVLHHIPDLDGFLQTVRSLQTEGGVFMHLQDPNGDYLGDPDLKVRIKELANTSPKVASRFHPRRIAGRLYRELTGNQGNDYISKTNSELLKRGVITSPLAVSGIFSITDIHVSDGQGVSVSKFQNLLPEYELIASRSYGFFGRLETTLDSRFRRQEERLIAEHTPNGFHVAAAWRLNS